MGRVFLWHATGYAALTWVAAIPVMVFLSGSLLGGSVLQRGSLTVITERFRRLLTPLWAYALAAWSVMIGVELAAGRSVPWHHVGFWILPVSDPVGTDWSNGWLSEPLWYLRLLLWLLAALPLLAWMAGRAPLWSIVACGAGTIAAETAWDGRFWEIQDFVLFSGFFIAGLATAHGTLPTLGRPWGWLLAPGAMLAAGWAIVNGIDSWTVNDSHVLHLAVGIATLGAAGLGIDLLRRAASALPRLTDAVARQVAEHLPLALCGDRRGARSQRPLALLVRRRPPRPPRGCARGRAGDSGRRVAGGRYRGHLGSTVRASGTDGMGRPRDCRGGHAGRGRTLCAGRRRRRIRPSPAVAGTAARRLRRRRRRICGSGETGPERVGRGLGACARGHLRTRRARAARRRDAVGAARSTPLQFRYRPCARWGRCARAPSWGRALDRRCGGRPDRCRPHESTRQHHQVVHGGTGTASRRRRPDRPRPDRRHPGGGALVRRSRTHHLSPAARAHRRHPPLPRVARSGAQIGPP